MSNPTGTGTNGAAAPPPVVRRGRGTFKHQLRTEEIERQTVSHHGRAEEASTIITAATTTVVLPSSTLGTKTAKQITEEEEIAAQFAHLKKGKDIPLNAVPQVPVGVSANANFHAVAANEAMTTRERMIAAAVAAAEARANAARTHFGVFESNATNDTARQLLFRGEKRRRYCVIVGDLQNQTRQVTLKLFGHKGAKPFKLQNKLIRLVNLSIGKPRRGTLQWLAAHGILDPAEQEAYQLRHQNGETIDSDIEEEAGKEGNGEAADAASAAAAAEGGTTGATEEPAGDTAAREGSDDATAEQRARQTETHAAAGFDTEEVVPSSSSSSDDDKDNENADVVRHIRDTVDASAAAAEAVPLPITDSDDDNKPTDGAAVAEADAASTENQAEENDNGDDEATGKPPGPPPALSAADLSTGHPTAADGKTEVPATHADSAVPADAAPTVDASANAIASPLPEQATVVHMGDGRPESKTDLRNPLRHSKGTEAEGEDVDHYLDEDEVGPLTVQQSGTSTSVMYETSIANSPVLTARRFTSLHDYFLREFRFLLNLEDVRMQNVSVEINLGAAYCCLARQNSYSTPLKHATFGEFVERMNTESMQLYFIKDCPACVSRAVDMESGSLNFAAASTTVKINFFSNERQSRSIARAVWDSDEDQFRLLDVENIGVAFNWTVFSLDEAFVRRKGEVHGSTSGVLTAAASANPSAATSPMAGAAHAGKASAVSPPTAAVSAAPQTAPAARPARPMGPAPVGIGMDLPSPVCGGVLTKEESGVSSTAGAAVAPAAASTTAPIIEDDDDEDDLARNKTVAYPFEVEFRAFRRWKQQSDNPAAPLAKAILEELSLAEHNYLSHGSSAAYERMDLTNVCEVDFAAEDLNVESIVVEHTSRVKPEGTDLLVDNTTSLFIENFAAARQLKERVTTKGPIHVAEMQNPSNNNYMRALYAQRRAEMAATGNSGGIGRDGIRLTKEELAEALKPTSKLTFFRSRGSTIHWKLRPNCSLEENIAPMTEALSFLQQVLHTANDIERNSARGGAAPDAL